MTITPDVTVASLATAHPSTIRVFQRHGIDFCCGGKRPLADACASHGVSVDTVVAELEAAVAGPRTEERDWRAASLGDLVTHIVAAYHAPLREELPRLAFMADKVDRVHGDRYPDMIPPLATAFHALEAELCSHMEAEEADLFPAVVALESGIAAPGTLGRFDATVRQLETEHDRAGALLARMHDLTNGFRPPDGACNTFRGLFHGLAELTRMMHVHVHLENNVLFPRALAAREAQAAVPRA